MSDLKFLGVCLIISALIVASAAVYAARFYRFQAVANPNGVYVIDSATGKYR